MRFQGMLAKAKRVQARRSRKSLEQHFPRFAIEEDLVTNQVPRIPNHAPATNSLRRLRSAGIDPFSTVGNGSHGEGQ